MQSAQCYKMSYVCKFQYCNIHQSLSNNPKCENHTDRILRFISHGANQ